MIPQKLIIEGVYSYKQRTEIDFSTLCKADLFGIFGNVGCGKSAILEAITYVLYGEAPRLPKLRLTYNMMNLSSSKMFIEFSFLHDGRQYLFDLETKRKKKDFTQIDTPKRNGYLWENEAWKPLFDKSSSVSAEAILGLNYDNFRRTVIVPQGKFQEFLHLGGNDRTTMLMELFNLKRFDLHAKTAFLAKSNSEKIASVNGALGMLPQVDKEIVSDAEKTLFKIDKEIEEMNKAIKESDLLLREYESLNSSYKEMTTALKELEEKNIQLPEINERKKNLEIYEDCRMNFEKLIDKTQMFNDDYRRKGIELEAVELKLKESIKKQQTTKEALSLAKEESSKIETMSKEAGWFEDLSKLVERKTLLEDNKQKEEKLSSSIKQLNDKYTMEKLQIEALKNEAVEIIDPILSIEKMTTLKNLYESIEQNKEEYDNTLSQIREFRAGLEKIGDITKQEQDLSREEETFDRESLQKEVKAQIESLAANLKDGKACPVCGSQDHPAPANFSFAKATYKADLEKLNKAKKELEENRKKVAVFETKIETEKARAEALKIKIDDEISKRDKIFKESLPVSFQPDDRESFFGYFKSSLENSNTKQRLLIEINKRENEQQKLYEKIREVEKEINRIKIDLATIESSKRETESRIDIVFLGQNDKKTAKELRAASVSLNNKIIEIKEKLLNLTENYSRLSHENERITTEKEILSKHISEISEKLTKLNIDIEKLVLESDYSNLVEIKQILNQTLDTSKERNYIEKFEKEIITLKSRADSAVTLMNGRSYNEEEHEKEKISNQTIRISLDKASEKRGACESRLKELKTSLLRKNELEEELSRLELLAENIKTLKNLFSGKKFINYAATIYLKELCNAANSRFRKLTHEGLRLELDEGNDFLIRDYLNNGKTRSVKTLSGGQTFQAAFSLSLALADSIGKKRSGFFFLDEGFGSLDKESLTLVFESLKTLKNEDRTVGIISHVDELKQEIDTFVTVTRTDTGSHVQASWEN